MHTFFRTKMPIVLFDDKLQKHSEKMRERERKRERKKESKAWGR